MTRWPAGPTSAAKLSERPEATTPRSRARASRSQGPATSSKTSPPLQPRIGDAQKLCGLRTCLPDGPRQSVHDQSGLTAELEEPAIGFQGILARCRVDTASQEHDLAAGIEGRGCITQLDALAIAGAMGERLGLGSFFRARRAEKPVGQISAVRSHDLRERPSRPAIHVQLCGQCARMDDGTDQVPFADDDRNVGGRSKKSGERGRLGLGKQIGEFVRRLHGSFESLASHDNAPRLGNNPAPCSC